MFSTTTKAKDTILEGELTQVETTPFRGCSAVLVGGSAPAFKYGPLGGKKKAMEVIDIASVVTMEKLATRMMKTSTTNATTRSSSSAEKSV